jgi:hypothetical protein
MIKTENQWKAALVKELRAAGALVLSVHGHAQQAPGWPDIYVAHCIWSGWIELKSHDGELSEAQRIVGRKLEALCQFAVMRPSKKGLWKLPVLEEHDGERRSGVLEWATPLGLLRHVAAFTRGESTGGQMP